MKLGATFVHDLIVDGVIYRIASHALVHDVYHLREVTLPLRFPDDALAVGLFEVGSDLGQVAVQLVV